MGGCLASRWVYSAKHGADRVKIYSTVEFCFKPNGETVNHALPSFEEIKAVMDEAYQYGLWTAFHVYGGHGLNWAIKAGVREHLARHSSRR
jgi:hypothetical protein